MDSNGSFIEYCNGTVEPWTVTVVSLSIVMVLWNHGQ